MNRFKEVNDRYGHPQGDVLLQVAASTLRKSLRTSDYAFRIVGDEFALLLPAVGHGTSCRSEPPLACGVRVFHRDFEPRPPIWHSITEWPFTPMTANNRNVLIRVADERLYQLKNVARASGSAMAATLSPPPAVAEKRCSATGANLPYRSRHRLRVPRFSATGATAVGACLLAATPRPRARSARESRAHGPGDRSGLRRGRS